MGGPFGGRFGHWWLWLNQGPPPVVHTTVHTVVRVVPAASGPNWAEIVTAIGTAVIAIGLFVAAIQVRESRHSRHAAIAVDIAKTWSEPTMVEGRLFTSGKRGDELRDFVMELATNRDPNYFVAMREPLFFEWLGALEEFGWIEAEWVNQTLGTAVMTCWERWESTVHAFRDRPDPDSKTALVNVQELAKRIQRVRKPNSRWLPRTWLACWRGAKSGVLWVFRKVLHKSS